MSSGDDGWRPYAPKGRSGSRGRSVSPKRKSSRGRKSRSRSNNNKRSRSRRGNRSRSRDNKRGRRSSPEMHSKKLWVGGLPHTYGRDEIMDLFSKYGKIESCEPRKGFAFLTYEKSEDAAAAKKGLHGFAPDSGRVILVEFRLQGQSKVEHRRPETYVGRSRSREKGRDRSRSRSRNRDRSRGRDRDHSRGRDRDRSRGRDRSRHRSPDPALERERNREREKEREIQKEFDRERDRENGRSLKNWRINLSDMLTRTSWQDIKDWGKNAGLTVEYTGVMGGGKGLIEFRDRDEFERGLEILYDKPLAGRKITIKAHNVQPGPYNTIGLIRSSSRSPARRSPARRSPARRSPARRSPARRSPARRSSSRDRRHASTARSKSREKESKREDGDEFNKDNDSRR